MKSIIIIDDSVFSDHIFSNAGFLVSSNSSLTITSTNFTLLKYSEWNNYLFLDALFLSSCFNHNTICFGNRYFSSHSMRMLSTDIEKELSSGFSAIIISGISTFTFTHVQITNSNCLSELCLGGALAISNSNGIISSSDFVNNQCK